MHARPWQQQRQSAGEIWLPSKRPDAGCDPRKRSEPECPYRGVFRLALQRVPSNLREMGVRQGFGREGEGVVALAWGITYLTV